MIEPQPCVYADKKVGASEPKHQYLVAYHLLSKPKIETLMLY